MRHYLLVLGIYLITACTPGLSSTDTSGSPTPPLAQATSTEAATPTKGTTSVEAATSASVGIDTPTPEVALEVTLEADAPWPATLPLPGLVYRDPEGVWFINAGGQPQLLTSRLDAVPAPDLTHAYYVDEASDIWLIDLQTGVETAARPDAQTALLIEGPPEAYPSDFATAVPSDVYPFGISGRWANAATVEMNVIVDGDGPAGLPALLDVASGMWHLIDETAYSNAIPALSPDGQTIAYERSDSDGSRNIFLVAREGGEARPLDLSRFTGLPEPGSYFLTDPTWSPNGRQLAGRIGLGPADGYRTALFILDLEAETAAIHRPFDPPQTDARYPPPVWSPDGQWIAWEIITNGVDEGLWLFAADGSEELPVSETPESDMMMWYFEPIWLDNGRSLTFLTTDWKRGLFDLESRTYSLFDLPEGAWLLSWVDPAMVSNR